MTATAPWTHSLKEKTKKALDDTFRYLAIDTVGQLGDPKSRLCAELTRAAENCEYAYEHRKGDRHLNNLTHKEHKLLEEVLNLKFNSQGLQFSVAYDYIQIRWNRGPYFELTQKAILAKQQAARAYAEKIISDLRDPESELSKNIINTADNCKTYYHESLPGFGWENECMIEKYLRSYAYELQLYFDIGNYTEHPVRSLVISWRVPVEKPENRTEEPLQQLSSDASDASDASDNHSETSEE